MADCAVICLCYGDFVFFNWLIQYAFIIGTCCWLGVSAVRYYDSGQCFLYTSQILAIVLLYVYKISQQYFKQPSICQCLSETLHQQWSQDSLHSQEIFPCEIVNLYGMPSLETLYMSGLFFYLITSDFMFGSHIKNWFRNFCFLLIFFWVVTSLWFTNNYNLEQLFVGVLIGFVVSTPITICIYYFVVDIIPYATNTSLVPRWMNLHDDIVGKTLVHFHHQIYDDNHDDDDDDDDVIHSGYDENDHHQFIVEKNTMQKLPRDFFTHPSSLNEFQRNRSRNGHGSRKNINNNNKRREIKIISVV